MSLDDLFGPQSGEPEPERPAREPQPATPREPKAPRPPKPPKPPRPPRPPREPGEPGSRTPLILGIIAGILLVAVIVTLAIALNRPSTPAPAESTPPATSAPDPAPSTPSATPTDDGVGEPVALDFAGTGFTLADADGDEVFTFGWRDETADAIAALTEAFGAAPTQRVEPGDGSHYPDYTVYQWDGFMLFDMVETPGGTTRADYSQPTYVLFSKNEIGGIRLTAEHQLAIGQTVAEVRAAGPAEEIPRGNVGAIRFVFDPSRSGGDPLQYSAFADTDGTVVTAILYYFSSGL